MASQVKNVGKVVAVPPIERFRGTIEDLLNWVEYLLKVLKKKSLSEIDPSIANFVRFFLGAISDENLVTGFMLRSYPHWKEIEEKNQKFFLQSADDIFAELPKDKVRTFAMLVTVKDKAGQPGVPAEDLEEIWKMFQVLVKAGKDYFVEKRKTNPKYYPEIKF